MECGGISPHPQPESWVGYELSVIAEVGSDALHSTKTLNATGQLTQWGDIRAHREEKCATIYKR